MQLSAGCAKLYIVCRREQSSGWYLRDNNNASDQLRHIIQGRNPKGICPAEQVRGHSEGC